MVLIGFDFFELLIITEALSIIYWSKQLFLYSHIWVLIIKAFSFVNVDGVSYNTLFLYTLLTPKQRASKISNPSFLAAFFYY